MSELTDEQLRKWEQELPAMSPENMFSVAVVCLSHVIALRARAAQLEKAQAVAEQAKSMRWHFVAPFESAKNEDALAELRTHGDVRTVYVSEGDWWMLQMKLSDFAPPAKMSELTDEQLLRARLVELEYADDLRIEAMEANSGLTRMLSARDDTITALRARLKVVEKAYWDEGEISTKRLGDKVRAEYQRDEALARVAQLEAAAADARRVMWNGGHQEAYNILRAALAQSAEGGARRLTADEQDVMPTESGDFTSPMTCGPETFFDSPAAGGAQASDILSALGDPRVGVHVGPGGAYITGPNEEMAQPLQKVPFEEQSIALVRYTQEALSGAGDCEEPWCKIAAALDQARAEGLAKGAADERERCARIADGHKPSGALGDEIADSIAAAIREPLEACAGEGGERS